MPFGGYEVDMGFDLTLMNFAGFTLITLLFLIASIILILSNRTIDRQARKVFLISCAALFFIALVDWFNFSFSRQFPSLGWFQALTTMITFCVAPAIPIAIAQTIFPERHVRILYTVLAVHALLEVASLFGGYIFWVDSTNTYHRGPLYVLYMATYIMSAIYLSVESIRAGRTYQSANVTSILAILGVMFAGVGVQVANGSIRTTWPAVSMAVFLYFQFYADMILRTDALTKLLNRRSYEEFLGNPTLPCTVIVIDVNDFKHVNDSFGHAYGDECLSVIASNILRAYGEAGLCYRTGGDEYTVMLTKQQDNVSALGEDLQQRMKKSQQRDDRIPGVSVGYAMADGRERSLQDAINEADHNMYEVKRALKVGRG